MQRAQDKDQGDKVDTTFLDVVGQVIGREIPRLGVYRPQRWVEVKLAVLRKERVEKIVPKGLVYGFART